jgi:two-component system CheB/CheR fusion protein
LIVEDDADSRFMLKTLLELDGYLVRVEADGKSGAKAILDDPPDVALVDIGLPGMDGYQVARTVRAERPGEPIYLVALTGYGRSQDREAVREVGFDEHLVKPLVPGELERILQTRARRERVE